MYQHSHTDENAVSLHDCKADHITLSDGVLSFTFPDGLFLVTPGQEAVRSGGARMDCRLLEDWTVHLYRKNLLGQTVREDWSERFMDAVNEGKFELEFVTAYRGYQRVLFQGYVWFDKRPYCLECDVEVCAEEIIYHWND